VSVPRFRRAPGAIWRATPRLLVAALPPAAPTVVGGSAAAVWRLLEHPTTLDDLVAALAAVTGEATATLTPQLEALLAELEAVHLVERVP